MSPNSSNESKSESGVTSSNLKAESSNVEKVVDESDVEDVEVIDTDDVRQAEKDAAEDLTKNGSNHSYEEKKDGISNGAVNDVETVEEKEPRALQKELMEKAKTHNDDEEEESDSEKRTGKETEDKYTRDWMPPPAKVVERPREIFSSNVVGLFGFIISGLQIYLMSETDLSNVGVAWVLTLATTTYVLAATWTFSSNLEGWTRFPYITFTFLVASILSPMLGSSYFDVDPWIAGLQPALTYYCLAYGPVFYIIASTVFAIFNGLNEQEHGFDTGYF